MAARPEHYIAKYWLRLYPFYLNKGLYAVCDGSLRNPGDWEQSWETRFAREGDEGALAALEPPAATVGARQTGAADLARRTEWLAQSLDPCVAYRLEFADA